MLVITCVSTFIAIFVARMVYEKKYERNHVSDILGAYAGISGITFCVLLITTNWNLFTIPKIILFVSFCLYFLFKEEFEVCVPFRISIGVTVIAFIVTGIMYINNIKEAEVPDVSVTRSTVICAKDKSSITGNISGSVLCIYGSTSEKSVYKYYYQLENGGIKQGTIPVDSTTIYFVEAGEEPYLETVVTTEYFMNNNNSPATHCLETSETTYKLHVPEESVTNVYEFDAE